MKNARIFLALLLIIAIAALAGCADPYGTNLDINRNATGPGIVNDRNRGIVNDGIVRNNGVNDLNRTFDGAGDDLTLRNGVNDMYNNTTNNAINR